ncbi:Pre-Mrna-Splicing Factor Atp-Dependent Rna Helicase Dhx15 [Manis pentadactyla]|nr:Pre-Mrna-Splicing Factor Atp-Dependent Rna Helicase Dhx15 [Manis pentadactyla]
MTDIEADGVGPGAIIATLKVKVKEPWLGTLKLMVSAQGDDTIQFQDYSEARVISKVMVEFQATETLALRKELGSGSDVTGECKMVDQAYETLALRKELGSGSDVTGSARWWIRLMMKVKCQILAPELELALVVRNDKLRIMLGSRSAGDYEIQFQDYSNARVISKVMVEFQVTGECKIVFQVLAEMRVTSKKNVNCQILAPELELALVTFKLMVSVQGDYVIQFQDYSDSRVISKVMVEFLATGQR